MIALLRSMHRPRFFVPPSFAGAPPATQVAPRASRFVAALRSVGRFLSGAKQNHDAAAGEFLSLRRWSDQTERALHQAMEHHSGCRFPW